MRSSRHCDQTALICRSDRSYRPNPPFAKHLIDLCITTECLQKYSFFLSETNHDELGSKELPSSFSDFTIDSQIAVLFFLSPLEFSDFPIKSMNLQTRPHRHPCHQPLDHTGIERSERMLLFAALRWLKLFLVPNVCLLR